MKTKMEMKIVRLVVLASVMLATMASTEPVSSMSVHTVFSVECSSYLDWQSVALAASHERVGQPGPLTRFLACDEEDLKTYQYRELPGMRTFVHRNAARLDPEDYYTAYNKPFSVGSWLNETDVEEEWILFIDSDMLFLEPVTPESFVQEGLQKGTSIGGFFDYLTAGVNNSDVASRFVPDQSRRDLIAKVGAWVLMHRSDMEKVAPNWLELTKQVRTAGPDIWNNLGDQFVTKENPRSWICEMYGYVFGAALAGVRQIERDGVMIYPGWIPQTSPRILHYGIRVEIGPEFTWDKHEWREDLLKCPTKQMPAPPSRSNFSGLPKDEFKKMELMIETLEMINEAISDYADKVCSPSSPQDFSQGSSPSDCIDKHDMCSSWADAGECEANTEFMMTVCRQSCKNCTAAGTTASDVQRESGTVDTSVKVQTSSDYEKGDYDSKDYGDRYKGAADTIHSIPFDKLAANDYKMQTSQDSDDYGKGATDYSDSIIRAKAIADLENKARLLGERKSYEGFYSGGQDNSGYQKPRDGESRLAIITGSGVVFLLIFSVFFVLTTHRKRMQLRSKHHKKVLLQKY